MGKGEGKGEAATSNASFEQVYADAYGQDEELMFENPVIDGQGQDFRQDDGGGLDDDEEENAGLHAEMEEIPSGISMPDSKRVKKKSKKNNRKRQSKLRMLSRQNSSSDDLENHEIFKGGSPSFIERDDDVDDEEMDNLIRKKRKGLFSALNLAGVGGGAMSTGILAFLIIPPIAINFLPGVPYKAVGQFLFVPAIIYIYLSFPAFLGWVFAMGLRYLGPLNGYPFTVGAIAIHPWIKDWKLFVRVLVQDAAFGNPPNFPFESFVSCKRLDMEGSISFKHLLNLITLRKEKVPLRKVPDFERYMKIDFNHIEVDDPMCNFQMYDGKFNINEFTKILANGEASAVLKKDPFPNQLCFRIIRAKNLLPHRMKKSCDPYVVVRARRQEQKTHTQNKTKNPMWNEELVFNVEDASVVLEVAVYDRDAIEGNQASLIGHWAMTTKYLVTDPSFCWHYEKDFETFTKKKKGPGNSTGFRGWVPLATKKWKKMGLCGQIEIEVLWKHVKESELQNKYAPSKRYTALEQLTQQSNEDQLRFGDWARVRNWLNHEPFCYDIRRFTVRGTKFYLQDLFRGHKGKPETLVNSAADMDGADCVKLPILEMRKQFRPKNGDEGITSYDCFIGFFIGLLASAARSGRLGSAIAQIMSGGMFNFSYKFRSLLVGQFDKAIGLPVGPSQIKGVASLAKSGFAVLHQNYTQNRRNKAQFKIAVDADDQDFLSSKVELAGHLDRSAVKVSSEISNSEMAHLSKKRGNFKTKYFELKGDTIFFRRHKEVPKGVVYNLTYKIQLCNVYSAVYVPKNHELLLNVQEECHVIRLRESPRSFPDLDSNGANALAKWIRALKKHDVIVENVDL